MKLIEVEMQEIPSSSQNLSMIADLIRALPPCLIQRLNRDMLNMRHSVMTALGLKGSACVSIRKAAI